MLEKTALCLGLGCFGLANAVAVGRNPLAGAIVEEKGDPGACGSLLDFFQARNGTDFPDLEGSPINFYRIKYKNNRPHGHGYTKGMVMCKRLPDRKATEEDQAAEVAYKRVFKDDRLGRFMCVNGRWTAEWKNNHGKWTVPPCNHREFAKYLKHPHQLGGEIEGKGIEEEAPPPPPPTVFEASHCSSLNAEDIDSCKQCCSELWADNGDDVVRTMIYTFKRDECEEDCDARIVPTQGRWRFQETDISAPT